jgi:hypothetical protein
MRSSVFHLNVLGALRGLRGERIGRKQTTTSGEKMEEVGKGVWEVIPWKIDREPLREKLRVKGKSFLAARLERLIDEAEIVARPKICYAVVSIDGKEENRVILNGVPFTSRILRVNLDRAHCVFPFVATCGRELDSWSERIQGTLEQYWADTINEAALNWTIQNLSENLAKRYGPGPLSRMGPGSLPDWPLEEQRSLFALLGEDPGRIGVRLSESLLMTPIQSVSGIFFPTEERFETCQLCPREGCIGRRASYAPGLFERKYLRKLGTA